MDEKDVNINWFPGHMKVALDEIKRVLPLVDVVILVGDARAPYSSINKTIDKLVKDKKKILVFSKLDLADEKKLLKMKPSEEYEVNFCNFKDRNEVSKFKRYLESFESSKAKKYARFNLAKPALRALIVGIPNVGKSTLINSLVGKNKASVANTPGHTKAKQLVKVGSSLELFDTPGIMQPNYDSKVAITHLAWLGSIKDDILPMDYLTSSLADFMLNNYREEVKARFDLDDEIDVENIFVKIAESRKYLLQKGELDIKRAQLTFLKEFREGKIAKVVVDDVLA